MCRGSVSLPTFFSLKKRKWVASAATSQNSNSHEETSLQVYYGLKPQNSISHKAKSLQVLYQLNPQNSHSHKAKSLQILHQPN